MSYQDHQDELQKVQQQAEDAHAILNFFRKYQDSGLVGCDANIKQAREYFNGDPITLEALVSSYETDPDFRASLAHQTDVHERAVLIEKIIDLLSGGNSDDVLESERRRFVYFSTQQLRDKLKELESRVEMKALPTDEVRTIVKSKNAKAPELPAHHTALSLKALARTDFATLKKLIQFYGIDLINKRLLGQN